MKHLTLILLLLLCLASCRTQRQRVVEKVTVERSDSLRYLTSRIDSLIRMTQIRDSIHERDSVTVMIKGDTVMIDRWHTVYREKSNSDALREKEIVHDTVYQTHTEYIDRVVEKETLKEVNVLRWWQKTLMWIGGAGIVLGIGLAIWKIKV